MTLRGEEFLRRFLQHILPIGFVKVRHYGIFAHAAKAAALKRLRQSQNLRGRQLAEATKAILVLLAQTTVPTPVYRCPQCNCRDLIATEVMPYPKALGHWAQAP